MEDHRRQAHGAGVHDAQPKQPAVLAGNGYLPTLETDGNMGVGTRGMETPRRTVCRLRLHRLALPHDTDAGPMAGV